MKPGHEVGKRVRMRPPLEMTMDICFVPSLQHLSCSKIVASLLNKVLPFMDISTLWFSGRNVRIRPMVSTYMPECRRMIYKEITRRVKEDIRKLIPCASLQKKLENFIAPLCYEIAEWLRTCYRDWSVDDDTFFIIIDNIPQCWLTDGTIDREKSAKSVVKSGNIRIINQFIFACVYCLYEDVLNLWELLSETEKDDLRSYSNLIVKQWIAWLESRSNKGWQFCLAWILGTTFWNKNMCALKRVLGALTPKERSHYFRRALIEGYVSSDVMRFGLSLMTRDEQELILKQFPVQVLKCITSWSVRSNFFDTVDILWPYLSEYTFCRILNMLLWQARNRNYCDELTVNLKNFWTKRPIHFQNIVTNDHRFTKPLRFVLECEFTQVYLIHELLRSLTTSLPPDALFVDR
ncbi:hypothetical protein AVEN_115427-1 [Araneus ventricosus]|uniref:Uncharacterized protein n=1 Tax=Araneus ventricosus TaxID=182803 RepID=A0A4Y2PXG7_ARAVE|nr:hypothetical protein AVEN_115427-1 [Araneus ventricosus]